MSKGRGGILAERAMLKASRAEGRGMQSHLPKDENGSSDQGGGIQREAVKRLRYLLWHFKTQREREKQFPSINESLRLLKKATNPRAQRSSVLRRIHPFIEMWITLRWQKRCRAGGRDPDSYLPTHSEIFDICEEAAKELSSIRGRPDDAVLAHHVHAFMALYYELTGHTVTAARTRNGEYDPHMTSNGAELAETLFKTADPAISRTALVNIIVGARRSGMVAGKRFTDFLPTYGWRLDAETCLPDPPAGYRLEHFNRTHPIYCS